MSAASASAPSGPAMDSGRRGHRIAIDAAHQFVQLQVAVEAMHEFLPHAPQQFRLAGDDSAANLMRRGYVASTMVCSSCAKAWATSCHTGSSGGISPAANPVLAAMAVP